MITWRHTGFALGTAAALLVTALAPSASAASYSSDWLARQFTTDHAADARSAADSDSRAVPAGAGQPGTSVAQVWLERQFSATHGATMMPLAEGVAGRSGAILPPHEPAASIAPEWLQRQLSTDHTLR